ncbi:Wadjet anti-phage system protein JetD domain-containing protein [Pseudomonas sp. NPDC089569]|uniref:Wadjet anti-phage system protein JetD domain-containing protein n=1 Tax=Pseudomonas sp. NPDC089569 TaxID=3390722 RepID=UPI003CFF3EC1
MKTPKEVHTQLTRKFQNKHREWLQAHVAQESHLSLWPLEINLGVPTEQEALRQPDGVLCWVNAWQSWQGTGVLVWGERRWRSLGTQRVPERLLLEGPADVAVWVGESARWARALDRYVALVERWPVLDGVVARYFNALADYSDVDFTRLIDMLTWISEHPDSNLFPRQLPIAGVDSKWLDGRKALMAELLAHLQSDPLGSRDFFQRCGLRPLPQLMRLRVLDPVLRLQLRGLGDISAPLEQLSTMDLPLTQVFIVENLQTGLAFDELPGAVVIMRLGYAVDVLGQLPWLANKKCFYWGDLDTHGFAILSRARSYLPELQSLMMDEHTLFSHESLWGEEKDPHPVLKLPNLLASEQLLYEKLKQNKLGQNVRLEQERISWDFAWNTIRQVGED